MFWNGFLLTTYVLGTRLVMRIPKWFKKGIVAPVTLLTSSLAGSDNCPLLMTVSDSVADFENQATRTIVSIQRRSTWNVSWWQPRTATLQSRGCLSLLSVQALLYCTCVPLQPAARKMFPFFQFCLLSSGSPSWRPSNVSFKLSVELGFWPWPAQDTGLGELVQFSGTFWEKR